MINILITGGCGFIGSNLINHLLKTRGDTIKIINIDRLDYCSNLDNIINPNHPNYVFIPGNICDMDLIGNVLKIYQIEIVLHLAAQSHVDNSFGNSLAFTKDNIVGTHTLLECAKKYGKLTKFIYMSTDEVCGDYSLNDHETPNAVLNPTNPYAATKASCELLVGSYAKSFKLPTIILRSNNVFGPNQYHEKLIPKFLCMLYRGEKCTIQGSGNQKRTFIHTSDVCQAIELVMDKGKLNEIYEMGSQDEYSVLEITQLLLKKLHGEGEQLENWITSVVDRDFNDFRYHVNTQKLEQLGWQPGHDFPNKLNQTIEWYLDQLKNNPERFNKI